MFINPKINLNVVKVQTDGHGQTLICHCTYEDVSFVLCSIYAPNQDNPGFFLNVCELLAGSIHKTILLGDFNLTLDPELDSLHTTTNNNNARQMLEQIMKECLLIDIWRIRNTEQKQYSYFRHNPLKASRLDFALVSQGIQEMVEECFYVLGLLTDHSGMYMAIKFSGSDRGKGFWKFNTSHLKIPEFLEIINKNIEESTELASNLNLIAKWEFIKSKMRSVAKAFARNRAQNTELVISQLSEKLLQLENDVLTEQNATLITHTKQDLNDIMLEKSKGLLFRSKCLWQEFEGKSSKYFYSLEKAKYNAKTCKKIFNDTGELLDVDKDILEYQCNFYKRLYSKDPDVNFVNIELNCPKVSIEEKIAQDVPFSLQEVAEAVMQLKNGKCPGIDGLPIDMYKVFWGKLAKTFHHMLTYAFEHNQLSTSLTRGLINLIPKANKDTRYLRNLRSITLLNSDYKIIEKLVANHIIPSLNEIIHIDQKGFMANRRISINIRRIFDIIAYSEEKVIEALILLLDFEKCFDKIDFSAILGSLKAFGFAEYLISWTNILYKNFVVQIQNNGYFSDMFPVQRSVHQGGPCSSFYFLICAEMLAISLRENRDIQGIPVNEFIHLLSQYADDADIFQKYNVQSVNATINCLGEFQKQSGFTVSYDKTQILRIGSLKDSQDRIATSREIKWTNGPINVLGIQVSSSLGETLSLNYEMYVSKTRAILNGWVHRGLSLIAKISIVNTLIASMFVYKMSVLPTIPDNVVNKVNQCIGEFIWSGWKAKISREILWSNKESGGLGLVDLKIKDASLKISWIQILKQDTKYEALAYSFFAPLLKDNVWRCNLQDKDVKYVTNNTFWQDVLKAWAKINFKADPPGSGQIIWWNSCIRICNKPVLWKKSFEKGLLTVNQLFENGKCIKVSDAYEKYELTYLQYNGLLAAIPSQWKKTISQEMHPFHV